MAKKRDYSKRYWVNPAQRGGTYAQELKDKATVEVSKNGKVIKQGGKPLSDADIAYRRGYLTAQSDNTGIFRYRKAMESQKNSDYSDKEKKRLARNYSRDKSSKRAGFKAWLNGLRKQNGKDVIE